MCSETGCVHDGTAQPCRCLCCAACPSSPRGTQLFLMRYRNLSSLPAGMWQRLWRSRTCLSLVRGWKLRCEGGWQARLAEHAGIKRKVLSHAMLPSPLDTKRGRGAGSVVKINICCLISWQSDPFHCGLRTIKSAQMFLEILHSNWEGS